MWDTSSQLQLSTHSPNSSQFDSHPAEEHNTLHGTLHSEHPYLSFKQTSGTQGYAGLLTAVGSAHYRNIWPPAPCLPARFWTPVTRGSGRVYVGVSLALEPDDGEEDEAKKDEDKGYWGEHVGQDTSRYTTEYSHQFRYAGYEDVDMYESQHKGARHYEDAAVYDAMLPVCGRA
jgi:hypothetical protein